MWGIKVRVNREVMLEIDNKRVLGWLKKNKCSIESFSDKVCPCCGRKRMKKDLAENPFSLQINIRICNECSELEKTRLKYGLPQTKVENWTNFSHGEAVV